MSVQVALETPLAAALNAAIQPKLVEVGWSTGSDDVSALAEYIILMLNNGKTQDQIAAELSGDLLNLGDDDPGARDFAAWLFDQVAVLSQGNLVPAGGAEHASGALQPEVSGGQDAEMGDASESGDVSVYVTPARSFLFLKLSLPFAIQLRRLTLHTALQVQNRCGTRTTGAEISACLDRWPGQ